ncbi:MAG TPA: PspC domain-containing protein [Bacteroidales bacterium]|jgi:phage shock protein PspC (stress-responsive transcriptional regulator)|nr:PspC domain-containing protein [Bacteroidales bacterium]HOS70823.1 PspC domain-containing protein [Bacteroidales bacterium]HQH24440.1 PspC domain-containing protein [Bacteroidales bacterium]HQJ81427.1 PspC domain-containing protein [Bacteroidales bacterium]
MKITVSINLGGYAFNIDEDAYGELKRYLRELELHFAGEESSSEILSDIEARMSELFRARLSAYRQVITMEDVRYAVSVLGRPEDFSEEGSNSGKQRDSSSGYHRMYRDPDRRIIGGVCAGIGAYWSLDPWIVRIIFIALILAGGLGIIIYLILYVAIPEARTTSQKIEMKGDPVNIKNITDAVRDEFDRVRKNMKL